MQVEIGVKEFTANFPFDSGQKCVSCFLQFFNVAVFQFVCCSYLRLGFLACPFFHFSIFPSFHGWIAFHDMGETGTTSTIVYGSGQGDLLRAPYLGRTADVRKDDIFITSGLAGRFPAGYPVGKVIKIKRDLNAPFLDVIAQPSANLGSAREVLLIWRGTDNSQASDPVSASESIDR